MLIPERPHSNGRPKARDALQALGVSLSTTQLHTITAVLAEASAKSVYDLICTLALIRQTGAGWQLMRSSAPEDRHALVPWRW